MTAPAAATEHTSTAVHAAMPWCGAAVHSVRYTVNRNAELSHNVLEEEDVYTAAR